MKKDTFYWVVIGALALMWWKSQQAAATAASNYALVTVPGDNE